MNFLRSLLPSTVPPHFINKSAQEITREKILQTILLIATLLSTALIILSLTGVFSVFGNGGILVPVLIALLLIVLTGARQIPYYIRIIPVLVAIFGMGVFNFLLNGISGAGFVFFIGFAIITGALLGKTAHQISLVLIALTIFALAIGMGEGYLPDTFPMQKLDSGDFMSWMHVTTLVAVAMTAISITLSILTTGLEKSYTEQAALAKALETEKENLEIRVQERTERLDLRAEQLRTIAEISRSISSILDQEVMFQQVVNLLKDRLNLYYVGIFIVEETGQFAILKAGTGEAGRQMVTNGHRLQVGGTSMIGWSVINRMPRIALDVGEEAVRFSNPLLPETRSELALPIISKDYAIGALTIQSTKANAFDEDDLLTFQGISDSLSVSLENARLFQQTQNNLNEIRYLSRQYLQESWGSFMQGSDALTSAFENPLTTASSVETYSHTIPVYLRNEPIGEIVLETADEILSPEDQQLIDSITAQAVMSLESARLLQETQRQAIQEEKINQISAQFTNAFDIQEVLETALKEISQLPSVSEIAVHLVPPDSQSNNNGSEAHK